MKTSSLIVHITKNEPMVLALVSKMEFEVPSCVWRRSPEYITIVKKEITPKPENSLYYVYFTTTINLNFNH